MKVVCIIQARFGSTRLPGKVLKEIGSKTVLELDIERIKRVKNIDEIVIATTILEKDDVIVKEAERLGIKHFRGSEEDVLSRYYLAAKEAKADVVVRVTSDCPLIDSEVTEEIIQYFKDNNFDYVSNTLDRTYPRGLDTEVFTFKSLEKAHNEATSERDREHVTPYIWSNSSMFNLAQYKNEEDFSDYRWTLDTEEDFQVIDLIYKHFNNEAVKYFNMKDIVEYLKLHPEISEINKEIEQKKV
ncbi:MAG: acylneuraminate cytidylyltransferase [Clostridiaceae bacterium]